MSNIPRPEKTKLFNLIRLRLGVVSSGVELTDEQLEALLENAIEDYSALINEYLIEQQWPTLYGLDLTKNDIAKALITRSTNYEDQFTYAISKLKGLQAMGEFELKSDYVTLSAGTQAYYIPAGREVNEVMWFQPPNVRANGMGVDPGLGVNPWMQGGFDAMNSGGYYMTSAYDVVLRAADRNLKQRLFNGDLTYKITAAGDGGRWLHLYNVPGGRFDFGNREMHNNYNVWYLYYDTSLGNAEECRIRNKDFIHTMSDVPMDHLTWVDLNGPSKIWVRNYLMALAKELLGRIRGKFSGRLPIPEAEVQMDYSSLLTEGQTEMERLRRELLDKLMRLSELEMLKRRAEEAEALNKTLSYVPLGGTVI